MLQRSITALTRWGAFMPLRRLCSSPVTQIDANSAPTQSPAPRRRGLAKTRAELDSALLFLKPDSPPDARVLKVGMLGLPGAGKSTLVNRLAMFQACAASQRINTTRSKQSVVFTKDETQLVFLDLPGMMSKAKARRHNVARSIIRDPHAGIFQADIICVVVDVSNTFARKRLDKEILKALHFFSEKPTVLVLTKADKLGRRRDHLLDATRLLSDGVVAGRKIVRDKYQRRWRRLTEEERPLLTQGDEEVVEEVERSDEEVLAELDRHREEEEAAVTSEVAILDSDFTIDISETDSLSTLPTPRREVDPMLALLREQMMLESASRQEVAARVRRWHRLDEQVRGKVAWPHFQDVFMISAATGKGVDYMREQLLSKAKPGKWVYHSSLISDQDPHDTVCLSVQANCLNLLVREVPYAVKVQVTDYEVTEEEDIHAEATIFCRTERHMKIVLGIGGETIKKIASAATADLENAFQTNVNLRLAVKRETIPKGHLRFIKKSKDFRKSFPMLYR